VKGMREKGGRTSGIKEIKKGLRDGDAKEIIPRLF
jgi:hypothetical protein